MSILTRFTQKIFGSSGNNGIFGSAAASSPTLATTPSQVQSLSAFNTGWSAATLSAKTLPTLEEMQGLNYAITYQLAYMLQEGIAEYDSGTEYRINSLVKKSGTTEIYKSIADANTGNALTDATKWTLCGDLSYLPAGTALLASNDLSDLDSASTARTNLGLGTAAVVNTGTSSGNVPLVGTSSATTSLAGAVELATDAEVAAATDTARAIVPSALASLFGTSLRSTNGYARLPVKVGGAFVGVIIQWGFTSDGFSSSGTVTLPITYPNSNLLVLTTANRSSSSPVTQVPTKGTTSFTVKTTNAENGTLQDWGFMWFSLGY